MKYILSVSLLLLAACGSQTATTVQEYNDGVTLTIPSTALLGNMKPDDISVQVASNEQGAAEYRLSPNGARFAEPLELTIPLQEGQMPVFTHVFQGVTLPVNGVQYFVNGANPHAVVPVQHFSSIVSEIGNVSAWKYEFTAKDTPVGQSVETFFRVTQAATEYTVVYDDGEEHKNSLVPGQNTIGASYWAKSDNLTPGARLNRPPRTRFDDTYTLTYDDFKCTAEGPATLEAQLWLTWKSNSHLGIYGKSDIDFPHFASVTVSTDFTCLPRIPKPPTCGNNIAEASEHCDGTDLKGNTCETYGMRNGRLKCDAECYFDKSDCEIRASISCNENTWSEYGSSYNDFECSDDCPEGQVCGAGCTCKDIYTPKEPTEPITEIYLGGKLIKLPGASSSSSSEEYDGPLPGLDDDDESSSSAEVKIEVIEYQSEYIPTDQLHTFTGPECDEAEHWHANTGTVTALSGKQITDSDECGFGKTKDVPAKMVTDTR